MISTAAHLYVHMYIQVHVHVYVCVFMYVCTTLPNPLMLPLETSCGCMYTHSIQYISENLLTRNCDSGSQFWLAMHTFTYMYTRILQHAIIVYEGCPQTICHNSFNTMRTSMFPVSGNFRSPGHSCLTLLYF